ncbi:MAG: B12-binding domain-containing radical SAM protein [Treponema sp.]|jgi:radical SAM superfamily enzyme YgiQ (UPF0313 family)|nr:B12-binding domain-containing radical SAM protein [Treponema sp.]
MNIVLATINAKWIHPSLALRLLKANLGALEEQCEILEFALRQPLNEKVDSILTAEPKLLGLSVSIWNHLATLELLKALEEKWDVGQKPVIVLGGPEVSWLFEDAEIFQYADYVIRGEGEESFRSLCYEVFYGSQQTKKPDAELRQSQQFHNHKNAESAAIGEIIVDVNKIETAYHLYTDEDISQKLIYVEATRSCPFNCEFCQGGLQPVREFPLEPFLANMETLVKRGVRTFKFLDRSFNLNIERAKKILEFFLAATRERSFCVHFEIVPSRFPLELKELIRRFSAGTLRLELGLQTLNLQTRALIQLSGNLDKELENLEFLCRETNAILHVDLIAGLPGESIDSFHAGFDRLWQVLSGTLAGSPGSPPFGSFEIQLGILKCLPGTPIIRHNEAYGMKYSPAPPYEVIKTNALSAAELDRIKNFARFWELIVNRNSFPDLIPRLFPPGENVFEKFITLSDRLFEQFGRNWGIDRADLRLMLENLPI